MDAPDRARSIYEVTQQGGESGAGSVALAGLVIVSDTVGVTSLDEARRGRDILNNDLTPGEHWLRGLVGTTQLVTIGKGMYEYPTPGQLRVLNPRIKVNGAKCPVPKVGQVAAEVTDAEVEAAIKSLPTHFAPKASELPLVRPGTAEWNNAVEAIARGGKVDVRVPTATDAKNLLREARGNMNRYKRYTDKPYNKGYEMHPDESGTRNAPQNDLPHIKWKDWHSSDGGSGHIFFDKPN